MSHILQEALGLYYIAKANEEEMCAEFRIRADKDAKDYWDAAKFPRKKKKAVRKQAQIDYSFHMQLSRPVLFEGFGL